MYSVRFFATVFALVQYSCGDLTPHKDVTTYTGVPCTEVHGEILQAARNASCKPHYRLVDLTPTQSQKFYPSVVSVLRCDGLCVDSVCTPSPKYIKMIKVPVQVMSLDPKTMMNNMCGVVEVEEHNRCKCTCTTKEADCNEKQDWVQSRCACDCKNEETMKRNCYAGWGKVWNETDCTCNCVQTDIGCMSGFTWNKDKCQCL